MCLAHPALHWSHAVTPGEAAQESGSQLIPLVSLCSLFGSITCIYLDNRSLASNVIHSH